MTVRKIDLTGVAVQEGRATVYADRLGNAKRLDVTRGGTSSSMLPANPAAHSGKLDTRFDDPRYYTGDSA